ncbi:AbfB domain-containing protein [Paenibacillus albus]|uniref:Uncharacterized protein n=1 Tax=Paenibacillus albus TaxID=2495582 RepID=A0A3S9A3N5_9BACL|nr:AbfB domain-containing protein [Paenibacillus albus]AZN40324.1 hypothetical protein EJC50_12220 [Paenibacillus albus]
MNTNDTSTGTALNQFNYVGSWTYNGSSPGNLNQDDHWTNATGSYYDFKFIGNRVSIYAKKDSMLGKVAISVDGGTESIVDLYSSFTKTQTLVWASAFLASGEHTVKVRNTGQKNALSSGYLLTADIVKTWKSPSPVIARMDSANFPGSYIRHSSGRGRIDQNVNPIQDSQWKIVAGLSDPSAVSFESVNYPGSFLRHRNGEIWLDANDGTAQFKADATWRPKNGLSDSTLRSYESYNFPGNFIRHRNGLLYNEAIVTTQDRSDATFNEVR